MQGGASLASRYRPVAGLIPATHVFLAAASKAWMPGTEAGHGDQSYGSNSGRLRMMRSGRIGEPGGSPIPYPSYQIA